jgi:DNA-binding GntR family transcriptional regulator
VNALTTASIVIRDRVRDDIVAGTLPFGSRLTLDLLAARYAVGHMPIREALRQLEGEGLVVLTPNRCARVRAVDVGFAENIFDLRIAIEAMLTRRAAERIERAHLARLRTVQARFERHARRLDFVRLLALNREFHDVINDAAANPEAAEVLARHWRVITALWNLHGYGEQRVAGVISDHRQIIDALAAHDAEAAANLAVVHAAKAKQVLIARMLDREATASRETPRTHLVGTRAARKAAPGTRRRRASQGARA